MRVCCLAKKQTHYYREWFVRGLQECGHTVIDRPILQPGPQDALVIWNRYGADDQLARQYEAAGGSVLVAENGFVGGDDQGRQLFAIARNHHLGAGSYHVGPASRHRQQHIDLRPWHTKGDEIVILPQRGIGEEGVRMPPGFAQHAMQALSSCGRPVRVRSHPGQREPAVSLEKDLQHAYAVVTWASSAAIKALCLGIPVFYQFDRWIARDAAVPGYAIHHPFRGSREAALHKISWAQWSLAEIEQGDPFRVLLPDQG